MIGQELKLFFQHDKAFLTPGKLLPLSQVGLTDIVGAFNASAFWVIRVLNYIEAEQKLYCEILSYHVGEPELPSNQKLLSGKLERIEKVSFRSIDTTGLLKTSAATTSMSFVPKKEAPAFRPEGHQNAVPYAVAEPPKKTVTETFFVPLKNVRFKMGGVEFEKKFSDGQKATTIHIANHDVREEFDAVKNYFANVLNTKKIQVTATVEVQGAETKLVDATSPEISRIDNQLIDNVKFEFLKATKKKVSVDVDKSLFTMDEYFEAFGEENFKSNTFYSDEKELFADLLKITSTKHYKHLRFLSSKHNHRIMKLRFVHKPFSFIFLLEGARNYHLVWETLDTEEATYIWHIEKNLSLLKIILRKIEDIIHLIKVQGKTAYLNSTEDPFRRIYHDYSDLIDGFVKWKSELESRLT